MGGARFNLVTYCGLALLGFFIANIGIRVFVNHSGFGADYILQKKAIYLNKADKFNIIFAGSSYMYRSIKPDVFSKQMEINGYKFSAYNFAAPGSYAFEANHYLNLLTEFPGGKKPDYLFINLFPINSDYIITVMEENRLTNRMIRYHDLETTLLNIEAILLSDFEIKKKIVTIFEHITHLLFNIMNVGIGKQLNEPFRLNTSEVSWLVNRNGYHPSLMEKNAHKKKYTEKTHENAVELHERDYEKLSENRPLQIKRNEFSFRYHQYKKLQRNGINVIYIIPPVLYDMREMHDLCRSDGFPTCFKMDDPFKYPELIKYQNRYDIGHLNDRGADYFSKYIADRFSEYLEKGK